MNSTYSSSDLKWVKNVKRNKGADWAYMEFVPGDSFYLNWSKSKSYATNAKKPKPGEIILLFQTVTSATGYNKGTYLTHLVVPLDNTLKIDKSSMTHPNTRLVGVIAKANPPISAETYALNFSKPSRGLCFDIDLVQSRKNHKTLSLLKKQNKIWNLFKNKNEDLRGLFDFISQSGKEEDEEGVPEGKERKKLREHKYYERNAKAVKMAKEKAIRENRLKCESCNFNFELSYPILGRGFIECHHIIPIGTGVERITKIEHLALLCSNCHRMIHRKFNGKYLSVSKLKELIANSI